MRRSFGRNRLGCPWWMRGLFAATFLGLGAQGVQAQAGIVMGTVADARSGQAISGAIVEVEGTRLVVMADGEGRYRIDNVPAGSRTVVARRLGYSPGRATVSVVAGETARVDLALVMTGVLLDEMVVTGTAGGERVRTIGSSVARINAAEAMELSRAPSLTSLLNARAPGVRINQGSGRVGTSSSITIRGRSSLGLGNSPLIYIDGVRVNSDTGLGAFGGSLGAQGGSVRGRLDDIHPEDIESIEIIKGPAAATIYGTEASNGVIQILTKRGASGQAPQFTVRAQYGSIIFRDAENRLPTNLLRNGQGEVVEWNAVRQQREQGEELFRRGRSSEFHASVSGGVGGFRYYTSAALQDHEGVEPNNFGRQFSLHSNADVLLTDRVTFATSLNFTQVDNHLGTEAGASAMLSSVCGHSLLFPASRGFCLGFPPELTWELYDNSDATNRFTGSGTLNYEMTDWFTHRVLVGMDRVSSDARTLERFAPEEFRPFLSPAGAAGRIGQTLRDFRGYTLDYAGTATASLSASLSSATSFGLQLDRAESRNSTLGGLGFPASGIEVISATATRLESGQSELINTTLGAYAQQKFGWEDRLFLTAALRVDNNSAFGEELDWVTYPKVDASWMLSEEGFWPGGDVVNTFRLRAAYGESGRAPNAFSALRTFSPVQGPGGTNAVTAGSLGNADLKPERGKEWEMGFETILLDRLSLDFTYFTRKTEDLIVNDPVAPSSGFSGSVPRNLGRVDNSGFELSAGFQALSTDRFAWQIDANVAVNEDEIVDLGQLLGAVSSTGTANREGYPIGSFWSRRIISAELDAATGQAINVLCDGGPGTAPVACSQAPFLHIGSPVPKTTGAISNTLTFGDNLRIYALVDFASGAVRWNVDEQLRCTGLVGGAMCEVNMYPENFSPIHVAQAGIPAVIQGTLEHYYQDASFVKLREVSANYVLPRGWIPGASRASLTLSGRELATWTDFGGLDPENTAQAILPPLTRYSLAFNIGF
jgi:TonB-linked SusC/RagA family outer membrane protein